MISTRNLPDGTIDSRQAVTAPSPNRVVPKPVPSTQAEDPRKYQIEQMKRRFSATQNNLRNGTTNLVFRLRPSDPDFPFELDFLECELQVPSSYPEKLPVLRVKNTDIPRGFSVNIERGWERLVRENEGATLLALTNALDKNLETFLSEQKADTVTLVAFKDTRHLDGTNSALSQLPPSTTQSLPPLPVQVPRRSYTPEESFSKDEIADAKARRAQDVRQLESRMGRMSSYQKSADGVVYTLPLEPKRRSELPVGLQSIQSVQVIIPLLYPLQQLRVLLNDVDSKNAEAVEEAFASRAAQQRQMTLTSHMNYLSQNLHILAKQARKSSSQAPNILDIGTGVNAPETHSQRTADPQNPNEDRRTHIHIIPRPPEWSFQDGSEESEDLDDDDDWDSDESDGGVAVTSQDAVTGISRQAERGTSISFPSIELHNIELLQIAILSLSVKCERCRTLNDISGLRPELEKASSCKKCATAFTVKFRQEMVHQNSVRAGFIDVAGCTVADMLPSTFVPTCSKCSTPSPGLVSVRGEATTNVCRECHGKFTFKIPEVKFLAITHGGSAARPTTGPRRRQEKLGLHAGEPLPDRGACAHYKRSYRWFRFSCCGKVHPCDRCHDAAERDHAQEWANRMICGWCSREQNYAPEACAFCGRSVIGKKGRGFWEGGKGTRDRRLMSRKDKRKFRRTGGGAGGGGGGGEAKKD
ncbi:putative chy zinc finger domain-containing protein [Eutypa lata UCREL1]|uniref:Putative chy zinc finger domain-containing protein n=1 Tax=Eutypa lata (strain UCR-EL1) TaxID=1287681 RepID=M7STZ4_EUTLA|nr:putative chy zinc finger domain-containing protein [Eutypa lata UCREL1]